jgi:hypothetical protein
MDVLAAAFRALKLVLVVFIQRENKFKGLLAILAIKFVVRHRDLQTQGPGVRSSVYACGSMVSRRADWERTVRRGGRQD